MRTLLPASVTSFLLAIPVFFMAKSFYKHAYIRRLKKDTVDAGMSTDKKALKKRLLKLLESFERSFPIKIRLEEAAETETRLAQAGRPLGLNASMFVSMKNICGLCLMAAPVLTLNPVWILGSPLFFMTGYFCPELYLKSRVKKKRLMIDRELPEAIEVMAIMVTAGMNMDQALRRTVLNLTGALSEELRAAVSEIDLGISRQKALVSLADRVPSDQLRRLVLSIIQAERYGTSLSETLRVLSGEIREEQRRKIKEEAQKIPIKMLFPLVFLILPAFIVLTVGPLVLTSFMLY